MKTQKHKCLYCDRFVDSENEACAVCFNQGAVQPAKVKKLRRKMKQTKYLLAIKANKSDTEMMLPTIFGSEINISKHGIAIVEFNKIEKRKHFIDAILKVFPKIEYSTSEAVTNKIKCRHKNKHFECDTSDSEADYGHLICSDCDADCGETTLFRGRSD